MNARISGKTLTFTAPGDNLLCGTAHAYQVVTSDSPITPQNFGAATALGGAPAPANAGARQSFTLPAGTRRYVAIRAVDAAGNLGLPAVVTRGD